MGNPKEEIKKNNSIIKSVLKKFFMILNIYTFVIKPDSS